MGDTESMLKSKTSADDHDKMNTCLFDKRHDQLLFLLRLVKFDSQ